MDDETTRKLIREYVVESFLLRIYFTFYRLNFSICIFNISHCYKICASIFKHFFSKLLYIFLQSFSFFIDIV